MLNDGTSWVYAQFHPRGNFVIHWPWRRGDVQDALRNEWQPMQTSVSTPRATGSAKLKRLGFLNGHWRELPPRIRVAEYSALWTAQSGLFWHKSTLNPLAADGKANCSGDRGRAVACELSLDWTTGVERIFNTDEDRTIMLFLRRCQRETRG